MTLEIKIRKSFLDTRESDETITVEGVAVFYFPYDGTKYKRSLAIFTAEDYGWDWRGEPLPNEAMEIPHSKLLGNNDEYTFACRDANITFWDSSQYNGLKNWFLRQGSGCTFHDSDFSCRKRELEVPK